MKQKGNERRRLKKPVRIGMVIMAMVMSLFVGVGLVSNDLLTARATEGVTVVDTDTSGNWSTIATNSKDTQNIGRIWTDKSVYNADHPLDGAMSGTTIAKGNSDFLVDLSAMSSTSNLRTTTTTTQPLDIVLVLDDSGSMADGIDSDTPNQIVYTAVSADQVVESHGHTEPGWFGSTSYIQDTRGGEYYVQNDRGGYDRVTEVTETYSGNWGEGSYEEHIRWTVNGQTVDPETMQFYTRTEYNLSERRGALQYAVSNFIDQAAAMNAQIADENDKIRISIVVFDSNSSIENHLTVCEGVNVNTLKSTVNNLEANGATNAGAGMTNANNELLTSSNREDTKQIVIFFTDGVPTTSSSFNTTVANNAVGQAAQIKNRGGSVYSVGIFDGADPSQVTVGWYPDDTDRANVFMNAVSSNYPNSTAWNNLGRRATGNPDFYKSADNAGALNEVFQDIFDESTEDVGSGSPIEEVTSEGGQETPGDLVFTDQLGDYMEVTGNTMTLVYADGTHPSTSKTTEGNVDTYHFEGQFDGNNVYGPANYADIEVTVTRSGDDNPAVGDTVTVTIPASLIPMRTYNVENGNMTITDAYPMRLFYGVSVKQVAKDAIAKGSGDVNDDLVKNHISDGMISLYSNSFASGVTAGLTTATFTPNTANKFYYYTQNTPLYIDESCQTPATVSNSENVNTFYYADTYWTCNNDGTATEQHVSIAIASDGLEFQSHRTDSNGQYYIPALTARQDRPHTLDVNKDDNVTGTASSVLVPSWNGTNQSVTQSLGNNGKISFPAPGELEIKKSVDWGNASTNTQQSKNQFTFTVNLTDAEGNALTENYSYYINGSETAADTVTNGGTITITPDQTVVIKGIPNGSEFTVTEQGANSNGFTTTDSYGDNIGNDQNDGKVSGTIVGGSQQSVSFTNTYKAQSVNLSTKATLQVQKNLTGRDWRASDEFTFEIDGLANSTTGAIAPEPAQTQVTVTDETANYTAAFGDIQFTQPGEYRYAITEHNDINPIDGIDYSAARYRAIVTVTDNGTGNLVVDSVTIEQRLDDNGQQTQQQPAITDNTMVFTNNYDVSAATTNIDGTKKYTDTTGGNPIDTDKFTFQLKAIGGFDTGSAGDYTVDAADVPMPEGADENHAITTTNTGYGFGFPTISYDGDDVGKTFVYEVTELAGNELGMSYDTETTHTVRVVVEEKNDPEDPDQTIIVATPQMAPEQVVFNNTYDPTDATITGGTAIQGTKKLTGRNLNNGEEFYFTLTQTGGPATLDVNDDPANFTQVMPQQDRVSVNSLTDGSAGFSFGEMTFSQVGTYTYTVNETNSDGSETNDGNGLTYSKNVATVTIRVSDNHQGALNAEVTYVNSDSTESDQAVFTNVYESSMIYGAEGAGGINVTKQLNGRPMAADEFTFTITGQGDADDMITDLDREFKNTAAAEGSPITMQKLQSLTFDQDDAGKTFTFIVEETEGDQAKTMIDYDQSQYQVDITVYDDGHGTMYTVTNVTKIMDAEGNTVSEAVVTGANSNAEDYSVPTFGFVNNYVPDPVVVGEDAQNAIQVIKTVIGAPSPEGVNYGFTMTLTSDNADGITGGMTGNAEGKLEAHVVTSGTIAADSSQTVSFGNITFSKPGTYTFNVTEDALVEDEGWTYDTENPGPKQVTVVISNVNEQNQYDGSLHVQSVSGNPVQVINSYKPGEVIVGGEGIQQQITVQKSVTGADSNAEFTFKLEPVVDEDHSAQWWNTRIETVDPDYNGQEIIQDVTTGESKTVNFDGIKFKEQGEYKFKITEVGAADFNNGTDEQRAGWTYDEHESFVTVNVTDTDFNGYLEASVRYDNTKASTETDKEVDNAAAFTNKYVASSITTGEGDLAKLQVTKEVTGAPATEEFSFELTPAGNYGDRVSGLNEGKLTVSTSGMTGKTEAQTLTFNDLTFNAEGEYVFNVKETNADPAEGSGWTYDNDAAKQITVVVTDPEKDGKLNATTVVEGQDTNNPKFTNSYKAAPAELTQNTETGLGVKKTVTGADTDADFSFTATFNAQAEGNTGAAENIEGLTDGKLTATITDAFTDGESKTVDFGTVKFTATGVYVFDVIETNADPAEGSGWTYDNDAAKQIKVTVTDEGFDGQLDAKVENNDPEFVNRYKAGSITTGEGDLAKLQVTKEVTGAPATEEFSFELTPAGNYGDRVSGLNEGKLTVSTSGMTGKTEAQTLTFNDLTFNAEGEYVFNVKETNADPAEGSGWTYDNDAAKQITVVVTDPEKDGKLNATTVVEGQDTNNPTFINSYKAAETTGVPVGFEFYKSFTGHNWTSDYSFTFTLTPIDGAPMPSDSVDGVKTITVNAPTDDTGTIAALNFGDITYSTSGTYRYEIAEVVPEQTNAGIKYDTTPRTVTVTVTDLDEDGNHTGKLSASVTEVSDSTTFTNTYESGSVDYDATVGLAIQKNLTGHDIVGDMFGFTLTATNDAAKSFLGGDYKVVNTSGSELSNGVASETIPVTTGFEFTKDNTGEYTFDVSETKGGDKGYTNDTNVYHVRIVSSDDGNGTLTVNTYVSDEGSVYEGEVLVNTVTSSAQTRNASNVVLTFNNTYTGEGTLNGDGNVNIQAKKELANRDLVAEEFTFNVVNAKDQNKTVIATGRNTADGTINFTSIQYSTDTMLEDVRRGLANLGTVTDDSEIVHRTFTYQYTVSETGTLPDGVTLDDTTANAGAFDINVVLTDNNDGTYAIDVVYPEGSESLTFSNTYGRDAKVTLKLNGEKIYKTIGTDNAPDITGKYTFNLSSEDGTPMPEKTETVNDKAGNVDFGYVTYTMENVFGNESASVEEPVTQVEGQPVRSRTFTYTVSETGEIAGVTNDPENSKSFTVTVDDMGDGTITVDPSSESTSMRFSFTNTYTVESITTNPTVDGLTITKNLSGRTMNDGEFTFQMTNLVTKEVYEGKNNADGSVAFPDITFTETGITEFEIKEVNNGLGGIGYDNNTFKVTATVTDNQDGTLSVEWNSDGDIVFNNTYTADPASMTIGAVKVLSGRDLVENEFTFRISDAEGNFVEETTNDANGGVVFSELKYNKAGEYVYTVSEVKGDDKDITYDESVYTVTVNVTDDLVGQLHTETSITKEGEAVDSIVFNNTYTEPEKPVEPSGPSTGVWTTPAPFAVTFTASLAAILAILYRRLR